MADRIHTLTADTVSTVTIEGTGRGSVDLLRVMNADGEGEVFYRIGSEPADPTVDDLDADVGFLPAAICFEEHEVSSGGSTVVKLISAGTPKVAVSVR